MPTVTPRRAAIAVATASLAALALPAGAAPLPTGAVQAVAPPLAQSAGYATPRLVTTTGTTLQLNNLDQTSHDLTSRATRIVVIRGVKRKVPIFRSPVTNGGKTVSVTGTEKLKPGDYDFYCSLHPNMTGKLSVR